MEGRPDDATEVEDFFAVVIVEDVLLVVIVEEDFGMLLVEAGIIKEGDAMTVWQTPLTAEFGISGKGLPGLCFLFSFSECISSLRFVQTYTFCQNLEKRTGSATSFDNALILLTLDDPPL